MNLKVNLKRLERKNNWEKKYKKWRFDGGYVS